MGQGVFGGGGGGGSGGGSNLMQFMALQQTLSQQAALSRQQQIATDKQIGSVQNAVATDTWDVLRQFGGRSAMTAAGVKPA